MLTMQKEALEIMPLFKKISSFLIIDYLPIE